MCEVGRTIEKNRKLADADRRTAKNSLFNFMPGIADEAGLRVYRGDEIINLVDFLFPWILAPAVMVDRTTVPNSVQNNDASWSVP